MLKLTGKLYVAESGYLMVQVPNRLAVGAFYALPEVGLVLPSFEGKPFNAHITVMRPDELVQVGGADKINERGKDFAYSIVGGGSEASRAGGPYSRYWYLSIQSAELAELRRSYGLPSSPERAFHITIAARPRYILRENGTSKLRETEV